MSSIKNNVELEKNSTICCGVGMTLFAWRTQEFSDVRNPFYTGKYLKGKIFRI